MTRVVCIGEAMVEFFRRDDGLWQQGFAGDTLNVAWALRALLPEAVQVDYVTRVGVDGMSDALVAMLEHAGIGTGHVQRDGARGLGLYTIQTDAAGERSFSYWRGASAARGLAADGAALSRALDGADLVYLSGITLAILPPQDRAALVRRLGPRQGRRFRLAFDPNIRPRLWEDMDSARHWIADIAALCDIVLPTYDDEALAFGDGDPAATVQRYAALGPKVVVVKDGTRPTVYHDGADSGAVAVAPAPCVVDTTGAGDAFDGAFLAALLCGTSAGAAVGVSADAAVALAQRVAGVVVGARGALVEPERLAAAFAG